MSSLPALDARPKEKRRGHRRHSDGLSCSPMYAAFFGARTHRPLSRLTNGNRQKQAAYGPKMFGVRDRVDPWRALRRSFEI